MSDDMFSEEAELTAMVERQRETIDALVGILADLGFDVAELAEVATP